MNTVSSQIAARFPNASQAFLRRNGLLPVDSSKPQGIARAREQKQRIRQKQGDGLNKTERDFFAYLQAMYPKSDIRPHSLRLELANGCTFLPDFVVISGSQIACFEVKGAHAWDDAIVKLKVAARSWPMIEFSLCSKSRDSSAAHWEWEIQEVKP